MNKEKIYELLDIDSPRDFIYFENFANLIECDEELDFVALVELFKNVEKPSLCQVMGEYFDYILENIPDDENEIYTVLDNVKRCLIGMASSNLDDTEIANFTSEIERFRKWYNLETSVFIKNLATFEEKEHNLRDALVYPVLEKLEGGSYQYDFSRCENYKMDEYIMSFQDMMSFSEEE